MKYLGMYGDHWTFKSDLYLLIMDSMRMVIARKTKALQKMMDEDPSYSGPTSGA